MIHQALHHVLTDAMVKCDKDSKDEGVRKSLYCILSVTLFLGSIKISRVNAVFLDKLGTNVVDFYSVNPSRFEFHSIALSIKSPKESSDSHDDGSIHIDKAEM